MEETAGTRTRVPATARLLPDARGDSLIVRGLEIAPTQLDLIQEVLQKSAGRTQASQELCRVFQYYQPNGWLKERAMRDILRRLAARGLIQLPPPLAPSGGSPQRTGSNLAVDQTPIEVLSDSLTIKRACDAAEARLWDQLIRDHHYLGRKAVVGRNLKQIVYCGDRPIACLAWADPCLRLGPRDRYLQGSPDPQRGINNTRFLLLPWVTVPNLASQVLSLATKHARHHWDWYYHADLIWAETFVDPSRFSGTCYLAANWKLIGTTRGTARSGSNARRVKHGQQKHILIFRFGRRRKRVG
jgi:hypothetical protein